MNDYDAIESCEMSHSIRQKLVNSDRFDVQMCAVQIAEIVASDIIKNPQDMAIYSYSCDTLEKVLGENVRDLDTLLLGDFFDSFPHIDIEIRREHSDQVDIDGYYYHTLAPDEDEGLIEVVVKMNESHIAQIRKDHLVRSVQSVLAHEMQHVVQRCHLGIDMLQIHDQPIDHLRDVREVDARVEEVLCGLSPDHSIDIFEQKIRSYIDEYCSRNMINITESQKEIENHIKFYQEKILQ